MELYQLRTFITVAEEGNFTRAGKRVHATQPAVSAHIKSLEDELGVQLFHRTTRGVELTEAGSELVEYAIAVLAAAEMLQSRAVTLQGEVVGQIALGLCTDPDFLHVSDLLTRVGESFPKLNLKLVQWASGMILKEIRSKNLDAGFVFAGNPYNDLSAIKLAELEYYIVGAAKWKDELEQADAQALSRYPWIMPASHSAFRELQLKIFRDNNISPVQTIGADSEDVIRPLVIEGKVLGLMRGDEAMELVKSGRGAICTALGSHPVEINFVYRKGQSDDPAIAALIDVVRNQWGV